METQNEKTEEGKPQEMAQPVQKNQELSVLEEAKETALRIEKGNAELKALLERQEKLYAESRLAGKGFAGQPMTPQQTEEQKLLSGAKEFFKGSEIEKALEKYG